MFKTKNNLRRNAKHKQQKSTKKSYPYEEDYNEVILNDLMKEDNENKVDNKEEPARKTKKRKEKKKWRGKNSAPKDGKKRTEIRRSPKTEAAEKNGNAHKIKISLKLHISL